MMSGSYVRSLIASLRTTTFIASACSQWDSAIAPSHGILWGGAYSVQKPTPDLSKRVSVLASGGLKDPLQAGSAVNASVARWRGFYGQTDPRVSFQNGSTTCKSTANS